MSLQNHLVELERRHDALKKEIDKAMAKPASDAHEMEELKRKKLLLQDEIAKMKPRLHPETVH